MDMSVFNLSENCGRIIAGVNTTVDVKENQIQIENMKLKNTVSKDGYPPNIDYTDIGKSIIFGSMLH